MKLTKKEEKETSKFNKGMEQISALLVNSSIPVHVGGIEVEVTPLDDANKRTEMIAEVAVVFKSFMPNPCGK